jgi:hypothetical protein
MNFEVEMFDFFRHPPGVVTSTYATRASWLVILALVLIFPTTVAAAQPVRLATQDSERPLQVRPKLVSYTGDGTGYLAGRQSSPRHEDQGGLRWLSWGKAGALARGFAWLNNCRPSCANGHFSPHKAIVRARRPRHGLFTRLVIKFRYAGRWRFDHRALNYVAGYYVWGICGGRYGPPC